MKARFWAGVFLAGFVASSAGAVEFFMPVPYLGGRFVYRAELVREELSKANVEFTYAAEGRSALGVRSALAHSYHTSLSQLGRRESGRLNLAASNAAQPEFMCARK